MIAIVPRVGDTLRTTEPMRCDALTYRAGDYLRVMLTDRSQLAEAYRLVCSGRWVVEERKTES